MVKLKRGLSLALSLLILAALVPFSAGAITFSDLGSHPCRERIEAWADKGILNGYTDGTFKPDGEITRAEFVKITNKAFGFTKTSSTMPFSDVHPVDWFYQEVRIARYYGYIDGYTDGTFRPGRNITRQEAAKIIASILELSLDAAGTSGFADTKDIDDWARGYVGAVYKNRIMGVYDDNTFKARRNLSRAECVWSLWEAVEAENNPRGDDFTVTSAVYAPTSQVTVKNLTISYAGDVEISNVLVTGNVIVKSPVADRTITIKNSRILGTLGTEYGNLVLDSVTAHTLNLNAAKGNRSVVIKGASAITTAYTDRSVIIDQSGIASSSRGIETLYVGDDHTATVVLKGTFPSVVINRRDQEVLLASGVIKDLESSLTGTTVTLGQGTKLENVNISASSNVIQGPGDVVYAYIDYRNTTMQRAPKTLAGPRTPYYSGDWRLGFTVKDKSSGKEINGALVTLDDYVATATTDSKGVCEFTRATDKTIYYTITKAGYADRTGSVSINGANRYVEVEMTPVGTCRAELTVTDTAGTPISGARGVLAMNSQTSSRSQSNGKIYFEELGNSTYDYTVAAPGYVSVTGKFVISGKDYAGTAPKMSLTTFEVTCADEYDGAAITDFEVYAPGITGGSYQKASGGKVVLRGLNVGDNTGIRVRSAIKGADGQLKYIERTVTLTVADEAKASTKKVTLSRNELYTYNVSVLDWLGTGVVSGVTVTLSTDSWSGSATSDATGIARITGVPAAKNYRLTATRSGYQSWPASGTHTVEVSDGKIAASINMIRLNTVSVTVAKGDVKAGNMSLTLTNVDDSSKKYTAVTNSSGVASFSSIPDGIYKATGTGPAYELDGASLALRLTISGGSVSLNLGATDLLVSFSLAFTLADSSQAMPAQVTLKNGAVTQTKSIVAGLAEGFSLPSGTYEITVDGFVAAPSSIKIDFQSEGTSAIVNLTRLPTP